MTQANKEKPGNVVPAEVFKEVDEEVKEYLTLDGKRRRQQLKRQRRQGRKGRKGEGRDVKEEQQSTSSEHRSSSEPMEEPDPRRAAPLAMKEEEYEDCVFEKMG